MSGGTPEVKFKPAQSNFEGVNDFEVSLGDLASSVSSKDPSTNTISTQSSLGGGLRGVQALTESGLDANLNTINRPLDVQLADIEAGRNSFFNTQAAINQRNAETAIASAQNRFSQSGLENSTVRGAFEGALANEANLVDLATRQAAIELQNQQALANLGSLQANLGLLAGIQQFPTQLSNQGLMEALARSDANRQFNAQGQLQADSTSAQIAASRPSVLGSLANTATSLGGMALLGGFNPLSAVKGLLPSGAGGAAGSLPFLSRPLPSIPFGSQFSSLAAPEFTGKFIG